MKPITAPAAFFGAMSAANSPPSDVISYVGAAIQERISGLLIRQGTTMVNGVRHYDFQYAVAFWLGTSVVSLILATSLWRARATD
jgi:OPA family sugar phosphate sensor protein UhpC-like MFS transporter